MGNEKKTQVIKSVIGISVILILTLVPVYFIFANEVYLWRLIQPKTWQGGLTVIVFIIVTFLTAKLCKKYAFYPIIAFGLLYLSMNGVIIPFLSVLLYFEIVFFLGACVLSIKKSKPTGSNIHHFIAGLSIWGVVAILCSLAGFGRFGDLRIMTLCLFVFTIIIMRRKKYKPLCFQYQRYFNEKVRKTNLRLFYFILLGFLILVLVAKTNTALDYDSLWYGLRPEQVLVGKHSFYDNLNLEAYVYYYPKLTEFFLLPLSNLGDYSFIITGNIFFLVIILCAVYYYCNKVAAVNDTYSLLIMILIVTIPSISGIATTAKSDTLSSLLLFAAWTFFMEYIKSRRKSNIPFFFSAMILCTGTKITFFLWGGILLVFFIMYFVIQAIHGKRNGAMPVSSGKISTNTWFVLGSGILLTVGIHLRTLILTGYPLYPLLVDLWSRLGFDGKYPLQRESFVIRNAEYENVGALFHRYFEFIFNPNGLSHVLMSWTTNTVFCFIFVWLLVREKSRRIDNTHRIHPRTILLFFYLAGMIFYMQWLMRPDGNYYFFPIMIITVSLVQIKECVLKKVLFTALIVTQLPMMFIMHWSWDFGTKAFDGNIYMNNFETRAYNEMFLNENGYGEISKYFSINDTSGIILSSHLPPQIFGRMNARVEAKWEISDFGTGVALKSYNDFEKYIRKMSVGGFLLVKDDSSRFAKYCNRYIEEFGYSKKIADTSAVLYITSMDSSSAEDLNIS